MSYFEPFQPACRQAGTIRTRLEERHLVDLLSLIFPRQAGLESESTKKPALGG